MNIETKKGEEKGKEKKKKWSLKASQLTLSCRACITCPQPDITTRGCRPEALFLVKAQTHSTSSFSDSAAVVLGVFHGVVDDDDDDDTEEDEEEIDKEEEEEVAAVICESLAIFSASPFSFFNSSSSDS